MFNTLELYYNSKPVKSIIDDNDEPWFIANDVCRILNLSNTSEAIRALDDDEKTTLRISEGGPERNIINEPGLYQLVMRSNRPEAKAFKRWITHELLPTIRKKGFYSSSKQNSIKFLHSEAENAKKLAETFGFEGNQAILSANRLVKKTHGVDCLELMGTVYLLCDYNDIDMTPTELGKILNCKAHKINKLLEKAGFQENINLENNKNKWLPTEKGEPYAVLKDTNKWHKKGTPVQQLFWKKSVLKFLQD